MFSHTHSYKAKEKKKGGGGEEERRRRRIRGKRRKRMRKGKITKRQPEEISIWNRSRWTEEPVLSMRKLYQTSSQRGSFSVRSDLHACGYHHGVTSSLWDAADTCVNILPSSMTLSMLEISADRGFSFTEFNYKSPVLSLLGHLYPVKKKRKKEGRLA